MAVFVLDKKKSPLMPCSEKRARQLLTRQRAVVVRMVPFTIRLKDRVGGAVQALRLKLDPGSRGTGLALVRETEVRDVVPEALQRLTTVLLLLELVHRGTAIQAALSKRQANRRHRRATLRYRPARFDNRTRRAGWLAPSLQHRVDTVFSWVNRLCRLAPITALSQELVRFDLQRHQNPDISGVEYQQGTLQGYELREYLLEKWKRSCAYCAATAVPLELDHIQPKSRGGSNRESNLTLACHACNQQKGSQAIEVFLAHKPSVLEKILRGAKQPLKDAAAVNTTRWALAKAFQDLGHPVELASGGQTKFNRCQQGIPKTHALDAVCVGAVGTVQDWHRPTLVVRCTGRGRYQRTLSDAYGFPRALLMRQKSVHGFQTGDHVKAIVLKGKHLGTHQGRVAVRATGSFNLTTRAGTLQGISHKYCQRIARSDGYGYHHQPKIALTV